MVLAIVEANTVPNGAFGAEVAVPVMARRLIRLVANSAGGWLASVGLF